MKKAILSFFTTLLTLTLLFFSFSTPASAESFCSSYSSGSTNNLADSSCLNSKTYKFNYPKSSGSDWQCKQVSIQYCGATNTLRSSTTGLVRIHYQAPVGGTAKLTVGGQTVTKNLSGNGVWDTGLSLSNGDNYSFTLDHGDTPFTGWTGPNGNKCEGFREDGSGNMDISSLNNSASNDNATVISKQCWGDGFRYEANGPEKNVVEIAINNSGSNTNLNCLSDKAKDCHDALIEDMDFNDSAVWITVVPQEPTPTPTPAHRSSCDDLDILSGNNSLVPSTVELRIDASDNLGNIQKYKFFWGDGKQTETSNSEADHKYESSGTFYARAEVKDSKGNWQTSNACKATVTVKPSDIESHKADCSNVYISASGGTKAPATINFEITGYDNKGNLQAYKLDFGNNATQEKNSNDFSRLYDKAGTYTVKAYVKDSKGNWQGGDDSCKKSLYINTDPITEQPETGTPGMISLVGFGSGVVGLGLRLIKRKLV